MKVFPTYHFAPNDLEADIELRTVSGGTSLSGDETLIATDGGGRVFLEIGDAYLDDPELALAWRAASTLSDGGVTPFIVPLCDARHQMLGDITIPVGGLPWWEESDFVYDEPHATLTAPAALRATTLEIDTALLPGPIRPGIWLSIDHATMRHRAYRIADISGDTVTIRPPLREAVEADTPVEFYDPKCIMRVDGDMRSPTNMGYANPGAARFVEFAGAPA